MSHFNHAMVDIETMGTRPNSPVLTIGAVLFSPEDKALGREFYASIDIADALRFSVPDGGTMKWWLQQSDEARGALVKGKQPLGDALVALRDFCGTAWPKTKVWGNGPSFDMTILEYAYHRCLDTKAPWDFWNIRDCRTIAELAGRTPPKIGGKGVHHNALDDAKHQARWVMDMWHGLRYGPKQQNPVAPAPQQNGADVLDDL